MLLLSVLRTRHTAYWCVISPPQRQCTNNIFAIPRKKCVILDDYISGDNRLNSLLKTCCSEEKCKKIVCGCGGSTLIWWEAVPGSYVLRFWDLFSEYEDDCDFITLFLCSIWVFCEMYIYTVPVKSLDTPSHSILYCNFVLYCILILKTSKLWKNTFGIMW